MVHIFDFRNPGHKSVLKNTTYVLISVNIGAFRSIKNLRWNQNSWKDYKISSLVSLSISPTKPKNLELGWNIFVIWYLIQVSDFLIKLSVVLVKSDTYLYYISDYKYVSS